MYAAEQINQSRYYNQDRMPAKQQRVKEKVRHNSRHRSYVRETCALFLCVMAFLGLNLFLLNRYAEITSVKHQVLQMEKSLEQLRNQREKLGVEIEKSSKLEWIEGEAVGRLGMKYPDKNQVIYISVDPARVALIDGELEKVHIEDGKNGILPNSIERIFHKFAGVLQI